MVVEFSSDHFLGGLNDERGAGAHRAGRDRAFAWAAAHLIRPSARINGRKIDNR